MNHLYEQLTALKLTGFRDALKKQLAQPGTYQELGFEERLSLLTAEELTCRENRKAERLIKHARFRLNAELSKLDYRNNRGLDRALIRSLSQGNWLTLKQNILLTGATGSGKTFLACALGLKWFTEFGHLNRGDMLTSEQHRCHNEKKKFQRRV